MLHIDLFLSNVTVWNRNCNVFVIGGGGNNFRLAAERPSCKQYMNQR